MKGKLLLIAGIATGYVIGARAGRPAYDAVVDRAERLVSDPHVRDAVRSVQQKVEEAVPALQGSATDDSTPGAPASGDGSGATPTARTPVADAAGSASSRTVDTAAVPGGADETSTS